MLLSSMDRELLSTGMKVERAKSYVYPKELLVKKYEILNTPVYLRECSTKSAGLTILRLEQMSHDISFESSLQFTLKYQVSFVVFFLIQMSSAANNLYPTSHNFNFC